MPVTSRRCGMITRREAERLCKSFLGDHSPPKLAENFAFDVSHCCACKLKFSKFILIQKFRRIIIQIIERKNVPVLQGVVEVRFFHRDTILHEPNASNVFTAVYSFHLTSSFFTRIEVSLTLNTFNQTPPISIRKLSKYFTQFYPM